MFVRMNRRLFEDADKFDTAEEALESGMQYSYDPFIILETVEFERKTENIPEKREEKLPQFFDDENIIKSIIKNEGLYIYFSDTHKLASLGFLTVRELKRYYKEGKVSGIEIADMMNRYKELTE